MSPEFVNHYIAVLIFIALGILLPVGALMLGKLLRPNHPTKEKCKPYESRNETVAYDRLGLYALFEMLLFFFLLLVRLLYAWRKEVLEWK